MASLEAARVLLAKARQDEYVLERFVGDANAADETFGFHAQQATEKLLKAALAGRGVVYPRTHRLGDLLESCLAKDVVFESSFPGTSRRSEAKPR